jgi:hypothetical protein
LLKNINLTEHATESYLKTTSATSYGWRETETYLKEYPEEAETVHVVMS